MTRLTGPSVLLLVTLCVSSAQDKVTLEVRYPQSTTSPARGSSVQLSCDAYYDFERCGLLDVAWYHLSMLDAALTDPRKYCTTVNETVSEDNVRRRQVRTEIFNVTQENDGEFQCKAECESGETSMGHYISISVEG